MITLTFQTETAELEIVIQLNIGGLGVRELSHVRYAEFIGGVMDGIPPLLPQHHNDGELHGKLNKLCVQHWIGVNYLMSEHGPWSKIISRNESAQCLRVLPNRDGILKNDVFIEAVRCILGLPSHILQPFADEHHFIGRNATVVDAYGIVVKNAMLINGDYHRMHASIQSLIIDIVGFCLSILCGGMLV